MPRRRSFAIIVLLSLALGCDALTPTPPPEPSASVAPSPVPPSFSYPPVAVVQSYLDAFQEGDCTAARRVWLTAQPSVGDGDLCPDTTLMGYRLDPAPAVISDTEQEFSATLTTTGTDDRSVAPGDTIWFYDVKKQPDGTWLIASAGSGP